MDDNTRVSSDGSPAQSEPGSDELRQVKLDKLQALQAAGTDPFLQVRFDHSHTAAAVADGFDELENTEVSIAGRLVAKRVHGKAGFADLIDESGRIQLFIKKDNVGDEALAAFKLLDIGDIIGCRGTVMKTRTGQISIAVTEYTLLCKTLQTLPEKFHGLTDVDQRYRQRYVDLIVNRDVLDRLKLRSKAVSAIRRHLDSKDFLEVETPMLHAISGGATAEPFVTHWNVLKADYYLRIAIELHLKRLIVGGFERVYEIGRVFRNEGVSTRHNPEFTMLELYWAYTDYTDIMKLTEDLIHMLARDVFQQEQVQYGDFKDPIDFSKPFAKLKFDDALKKWAGCGLADLKTLDDVKREAKRLEIELPEDRGYEHCLDEIFKENVEPNLIQPTFIYDYPVGLSPLAKRMTAEDKAAAGYPADLDLTYRFELFAATMELANSFSELNDPVDQKERFVSQLQDTLGNDLYSSCIHEINNAVNAKGTQCVLSSEYSDMIHHFDLFDNAIEASLDSTLHSDGKWDTDKVISAIRITKGLSALGYRHLSSTTVSSRLDDLVLKCRFHQSHQEVDRILKVIEGTRIFDSARVDEDFLTALEYGMPPTGGLGIGIDRLLMVLSGTTAIREIIIFPQLRQGKK